MVSTGERLAGADALARVGPRADPARARRRASRSINGTQFMAAFGALGLVRARRLAKAADLACALSLEALQGSRTSFIPQIHALRPLRGQRDVGGERPAPARRLGDHRGAPLVRQGAGRVLAALRAAGARRGARPARLRRLHRLDRAERGDRQPARARRGRACSSRTGTSTASRSRSRSTRWRWRSPSWRASPSGASSGSSTRTCPTGCRRSSRRDGGLNSGFMIPQYVAASLVSREQGALPSGERRLDPDERRAGGSRVDGQRRRAEGVAGARERRARARDRAARRRAGGRVPRAARAGRRRARDARGSCARSRRGCEDDRSLSADIEAVADGRSATARSSRRSRPRSASCDERRSGGRHDGPARADAARTRQRSRLRRLRGRGDRRRGG